MSDHITQEDSWRVISAFFAEHGLASQQISSFNVFIEESIPQIVEELSPITATTADGTEIQVRFEGLTLHRPYSTADAKLMLPQECRLRGLTYQSTLSGRVVKTVIAPPRGREGREGGREETREKVWLCDIPLMLGSSKCNLTTSESEAARTRAAECVHDEGGYFVINGTERVLVAQETMASNTVIVYEKKQPATFTHAAEIRSGHRLTTLKLSTKPLLPTEKHATDGWLHVALPALKQDIPLVVVLRALGVVRERQLVELIVYDMEDDEMIELVLASLAEARAVADCLDLIGSRATEPGTAPAERARQGTQVLANELLPHVGGSPERKALFLGYMAHRLLLTRLGRRAPDNRDHLANKRYDLAGQLLASLFRTLYFKFTKELRRELARARPGQLNMVAGSCRTNLTRGLAYALATGNWGGAHVGVSQVVNRLTYMSHLSHLRRLTSNVDRAQKLAAPRQLHNTQWGLLCPAETPEGQACGLVKNLALMAHVTADTSVSAVLDILALAPLVLSENAGYDTSVKIFVNGDWCGTSRDAEALYQTLRAERRAGGLDPHTSIVFDRAERELRLRSDAGRLTRPLYVVEGGQLAIRKTDVATLGEDGWKGLVQRGLVEFVDAEEEETLLVCVHVDEVTQGGGDAMRSRASHCEIHPSMVLGVCASIIPFPDHNQAPRNTYQSAMGKQALGMYATNYQKRLDATAHLLYYPQSPLVTTRAMEYLHSRELPAGINAVVAIACYTGYNQEDSVILNQGAVDRGLFRSVFFRTYRGAEERDTQLDRPSPETTRGVFEEQRKLEADGLPRAAQRVSSGDVLIGRTTRVAGDAVRFDRRDSSVRMRATENGIVDTVMLSCGDDDASVKVAKVRIRNVRVPQIGDKFASRHGQKGTCGIAYRPEDMPFTSEGITPDIIINPHAIPSRMTIGHLIECLQAKVACLEGAIGDATPFNAAVSVDAIGRRLDAHGYHALGNEILFNGHTGRKIGTPIYLGPTFYQRLKHMVDDKMHARARGRVQNLNRQPMEGRARDGGLRFGEMERDVMIAHGATQLLKERLMDVSDRYVVHVCDRCGLICRADYDAKTYDCKGCGSSEDEISRVQLPYAAKLMFQELLSMSIVPRLFAK